jgi:hypothetical protein
MSCIKFVRENWLPLLIRQALLALIVGFVFVRSGQPLQIVWPAVLLIATFINVVWALII